MKKLACCAAILLLSFINVKAEVRLPRLVSNGMILQRDQTIKIWGWADIGEKITLTFNNKIYKTKANADQKWAIDIKAQKAGGPYNMRINNIEIKNLLFGDVWLCTGQSNMEAAMGRANIKANYSQIIQNSNYPEIRQFTVKRDMAFTPMENVISDSGWVSVNPETILSFSAVAFFFAKDLYEKYQIPIGIINSSVGGTPIQSWVDYKSLKSFPGYEKIAKRFQDPNELAQTLNAHQLKSESWYKSVKEDDLGLKEKWFEESYHPQTDWKEITNLKQFNTESVVSKYGVVWFKTEMDIPASMMGKTAILSLGMMHTEDETFVNGHKIGSINSGYTARDYKVNPGLFKAGKNSITIRLTSPTNGLSFDSKNNYLLHFEKDTITLNEPWKYKFGIEKELLPKGNGLSLHTPTAYYYAMVKPLSNYKIKGILWYQGESNIPKPEEYQSLLGSLINQWRKDWQDPMLPFIYVQLANYLATDKEPENSNWALLREAQMRSLEIPYTAMAVIHDIGEKDDLHPRNKSDVGKRLALGARKIAYHENIVFSGPIYKSITIDGENVVISFDHVGSGLKFIGEKLNYFSISDDGKNFIPAKAKIVNNQVVVWNELISKPIAVRYAWADSPDGANLYNQEGLPASSFKSN
ncbi:sialate O-acetylesterase [Pedobacter jamesrossensis]|uniref:Sialate O-acetylesterase n=1 Tax=Pedobacter jamesrossensis TaxID=1908238 RepID=A0ABV8NLK1_9SPHI